MHTGAGVLRLAEFRLMLRWRFGEAGRAPPSMEEAARMFAAADGDGSGTLGVDELASIFETLELPAERPDYLR